MKIATLGPEGTFSHEAALKYNKKAEIVFKHAIWEVFEAIQLKEAGLGAVPVENSVAGTVGATLDDLMDTSLNIRAELLLPIRHQLVGANKREIKKIYAHPQTAEQCARYLRKNFPQAEIIFTSSNGRSAEILTKKKDETRAAIVPKIAAEIYKLKILDRDIQDSKFNTTRFFIIGEADKKRTGKDRTSIAVYPQVDRPGLLHEILGFFAERKINLTKIESRPSKGRLGDYIFFIDFEGHKTEKRIKETLAKIEETSFLKVLGSYPRVY